MSKHFMENKYYDDLMMMMMIMLISGNITILSDPCCGTSTETSGHCVPGNVPCSNRDEYLFWDSFHPTEAATLISANIAYNEMSPLYADLMDVW